jgi:glycosyltransferase involved in cell wall biosynthesis
MTLHDLSPWMDERWHHAAGRVSHRTPLLLDLGIATMVITPGEAVRKQAIERFRLKPERVVAVPEAAPTWLRPVAPNGPPRNPYFLYVGTLEPRKNLGALVEAWSEVRRRHAVDLVLAGRRRADFAGFEAEPGLDLPGEVADADLAALYSGAVAFVYPSLYEGFGLPVLEAMQCGACVIASPAVEEAAGGAAAYARDPGELAALMEAALTQPEWLAERRARSLARAREFSWEKTARMTYEVYGEARRRFGR